MILESQLKKLFPKGNTVVLRAICAPDLDLTRYGITTPRQLAHFLAQAAHETGGFRWLVELGDPNSTRFTRYDTHQGLGNEEPGDGYKYRGRGVLMITGRWNYKECGRRMVLNLIDKPWLLEHPEEALKSGLQYWNWNKLYKYDNVVEITKRLNGGLNGLSERQRYFELLLRAVSH